MRIRMVVTAVSEKEATLEVQTLMGAINQKEQAEKQVIDLTKPYDQATILDYGNKGKKSQKLEEGKEKITLGGKSYDCNWITAKAGDGTMDVAKMWFAKDVPLTGLLKMEMKSDAIKIVITVELTGTGRK
jgi:hypothetical protein